MGDVPVSRKPILAPVYQPSAAYHPPVAAPPRLGADTVSMEELKSSSFTWKVVLSHVPVFDELVNAPDISPYLSTMSLDSFIPFDLITKEQVDAIDADLARLPRSQWPAL